MARFIYLGKKKDFKLDPVYQHQEPLNAGDEFELKGKDLLLLSKAIKIGKEHGGGVCQAFKLVDEYEIELAEKAKEQKKKKKTTKKVTKKLMKALKKEAGE